MLTGVHAIACSSAARAAGKPAKEYDHCAAGVGVAAHCLILAVLVAIGWWPAALAWIAGMGVFFPLLRNPAPVARASAGGRSRRNTAPSPGCSATVFLGTFGGAGFNRHMLHHLEPQVSYTRLGDLEAYLMTTRARDELDARRTHLLARLRRADRGATAVTDPEMPGLRNG